ncbi:Fur family transcriptional regulator [Sphingobacterium suaedae]|uniref:Fur family transcriptional regulator n=1 Tax=Sphingobacterium suaedae TaxID=1686402 RepID=A0ABW5KDL9_9SPHI
MKKEIEDKLIQKHTKPTTMRILVYEVLMQHDIALSLSEIERAFQVADRVTIYRTLKTFEERGIVHRISENNTSKYKLCGETCTAEKHQDRHLHFYCKHCKETTCGTTIQLPSGLDASVKIDEVRFFATGTCTLCLKKGLQ